MIFRRVVDAMMAVTLLLLMSKQVIDDAGHEYIGMFMGVLVMIHLYLNRQWFATIFKGRYSAVRALSVAINIALVSAFVLSGISGMLIAETFTFTSAESLTELGRTVHIASSYWGFMLMGLHIGMHWRMIAGRVKTVQLKVLGVLFSFWGMYRFVLSGMIDYLSLRSHFVFLDYEKNPVLVILENTAMLAFCILVGHEAAKIAAGVYGRS